MSQGTKWHWRAAQGTERHCGAAQGTRRHCRAAQGTAGAAQGFAGHRKASQGGAGILKGSENEPRCFAIVKKSRMAPKIESHPSRAHRSPQAGDVHDALQPPDVGVAGVVMHFGLKTIAMHAEATTAPCVKLQFKACPSDSKVCL